MTDLNKLRSEFEAQHSEKVFKIVKFDEATNAYCLHAHLPLTEINLSALAEINYGWDLWQKAKAQAVPTWISVKDEEPPTDIMVLICWADAPDVTPEQDYMTIDEDLNSVWANYQNDPPSHWMHFHSVPNVSGAEQ
ncbi:hypothetical protein ACWY3I_002573 [Acinetobacter baumannii]|uniref:hypothetical protein n=1 Tax=Acinetobacter baumannii TaxID=470 RepID=UPI00165FF297|nr:hypothetical protein [Acinetobacter baumannii]EKU5223604.1 hypothetical protein [Acinetobacter baumannii]EKU6957997.1 hypothetical protein [Acinetobacter baumannii]EKV1068330.1 hypothetical protein [Acinetobacter baumannii]EKV1110609.1 hypothetical protein [Acinetobacter baumannii]EKV1145073.1 hypothetical protein [Acinetobacter baumannii]